MGALHLASAVTGVAGWLGVYAIEQTYVPEPVDSLSLRLVVCAFLLWLGVVSYKDPAKSRSRPRLVLNNALTNGVSIGLLLANELDPIYLVFGLIQAMGSAAISFDTRARVLLAVQNLTLVGIGGYYLDAPRVPVVVAWLAFSLVGTLFMLLHRHDEARARMLEDRHVLLDTIFHGPEEAVLLTEADGGRIRYVNARAAELFGYPSPDRMRALDSTRSLRGIEAHVPGLREHGHGRGTVTCIRSDGRTFPGDVIIDRCPSLGLVITRLLDATKRLETEARLRRARDEARSGLAARDAFLGLVSHELRTPLNGLLGLLPELEMDQGPAALEAILDSAKRLDERVRQVLAFSSAVASAEGAPQVVTDVREVVSRVVTEYRERGLPVGALRFLHVPERLVLDRETFRTVLEGLLGNVSRHAAYAPVEVALSFDAGTLGLTIHDGGPGLPAAVRARVGEAFSVSDVGRRMEGGLGLGLAVASRLAENAGGRLELPPVAHGTRAELTLPAAPAPEVERPPKPRTSMDPSHRRVLVVEDDAVNRMVIKRMLSKMRVEVFEAVDGPSGVAATLEHAPDLVLMDLHMPGCTGWEAARQIRARLEDAPPIVAVTASTSGADLEAAMDAGMRAILSKPLQRPLLRDVVERFVGAVP